MNDCAVRDDGSAEALVGQVADEFTERLHRGEQPTVEEPAREGNSSLARPAQKPLPLKKDQSIRCYFCKAACAAASRAIGTRNGLQLT